MSRFCPYFRATSPEILASVDRFCEYYRRMNLLVDKGRIQSSLDRGAFVRPQDILNDQAWELLGSSRNSLSYAYGPEAGEDKVRELIAELENKRFGTSFTRENVVITCGAWAGVNVILEELFGLVAGKRAPGALAVVGPTHFQLFHRAINMLGIDVQAFNFCFPGEIHVPRSIGDFDEIFSINPRAIFLTNPTNPDAIFYSPTVIQALVEKCAKAGVYLILDEIQDFLRTPETTGLGYGSWIEADHVIRVDSFSKKRGLADYRVGWVVASSELLGTRTGGIIGRLSGFMGNAPRAANCAIEYLLRCELDRVDGKPDALASSWQVLEAKEALLLKLLREIPEIIEILPREACINRVIRVRSPFDDLRLATLLMDAGTLIMACGGYGYRPEDNYLRITFAERDEKIRHSIATLGKILRDPPSH